MRANFNEMKADCMESLPHLPQEQCVKSAILRASKCSDHRLGPEFSMCPAALLCRRIAAGRQMEKLMMSPLTRNEFMMSFFDGFFLVGPLQVICDFCKGQGGGRRALRFPVESYWMDILALKLPQHPFVLIVFTVY